ncbi:MAG: NAD(P)/FAD-dependent oxidoreductase [Pseudomonadota bacterium]
MSRTVDVLIIGAGAAGMFCAAEAAQRGRRVLLVDHAKKPGEKIRISGGGRCNFTNLHCAPDRFISENSRFAISALSRYDQHDFLALVEAHEIEWYEKTLGQLFCAGRSTEIVEMLRSELGDAGADLRLSVEASIPKPIEGGFSAMVAGEAMEAESVVVATGGKSIPKMGATDFGYRVAAAFDLDVTETRAALAPFTLDPSQKARFAALPGVAVDVEAEANGARFEEAMLFTHRGLSGPAMLQTSSYWREGDEVRIAFGDVDALHDQLKTQKATHGRRSLAVAMADILPKALAQVIAAECDAPGNMADQSDKRLRRIAEHMAHWRLKPVGTEGYRTAEVTLGGVSTAELDSRTMEAKRHPGLYFIGEVVDVTGWLGGYNFQWAWSSAWAAGQVA